MKSTLAAVVASVFLGCMKPPAPVNAPVVVEIPPMPPQPTGKPAIEVRRQPPRPIFHYAFRLDRAEEWVTRADSGWTALLGEKPDLVLHNALRGMLISFQPVREEPGGAEAVAQTIVASDFTGDGIEPEEIGNCNAANGSECARFGWQTRNAGGDVVRQGIVFVIRFAHVERYVFALYAEWDVSSNTWSPHSEVDNLVWSFTTVVRQAANEK